MNLIRDHPDQGEDVLSQADLTLEKLLDQARSQVWYWLARWVADPEVVADLTQEILIKTWEARRHWDPQRGFWPWLLRITVNHFCDWQRRQPRDLLAQALSWEEVGPLGDCASEEPSPEEIALRAEMHSQVRSAVSNLPSKYREVLWLYYLEGWNCAKIAKALNLTVTQVEGRLFRGRSMLKCSLKPFFED